MTFISYAQNFEDVMLWRALEHVNSGFYIDIGAAWPEFDSVTAAFYERGWSGINIEPNPELFAQLADKRVRDINLDCAISDSEGIGHMQFFTGTGLSTLDEQIAIGHVAEGLEKSSGEVDIKTLSGIWSRHVPANQPVHFLKIDVEGWEEPALKSNDWHKNRPWIIIIEATLPSRDTESHAKWEALITTNEYIYAYADGLNRFYVAQEHKELLPAFRYPPNCFDRFTLAETNKALVEKHRSELKASAAEEKASAAEEKASAAEEKASAAEEKASAAEKKALIANQGVIALRSSLAAVKNSLSWKVTAPLRAGLGCVIKTRMSAVNAINATLFWRSTGPAGAGDTKQTRSLSNRAADRSLPAENKLDGPAPEPADERIAHLRRLFASEEKNR